MGLWGARAVVALLIFCVFWTEFQCCHTPLGAIRLPLIMRIAYTNFIRKHFEGDWHTWQPELSFRGWIGQASN